MGRVVLLGGLLLAGCGSGLVERAMDLEIRGLSARASALILKTRIEPLSCRDLTPGAAADLTADETQRWDRASGAERAFALEPLSADSVTLIAVALDDAGAPMQVGCRTVTYEELGNLAAGQVVIVLSRRPTAAPSGSQ